MTKQEQQQCAICLEHKATARIPCTCLAYVCKDCWETQNQQNLLCIVCRKSLPLFVEWSMSRKQLRETLVFLLAAMITLGIDVYLLYCLSFLFGNYTSYIVAMVGTCFSLQDTFTPGYVNKFFHGESATRIDGAGVIAGFFFALIHLFVFFGGLAPFAECSIWFLLFCVPALLIGAVVATYLSTTLLTTLLVITGLRIDAIHASEFK